MVIMKSISVFVLLIYWSIIILAPVISKERVMEEKKLTVTPKIKSNK
jgi:hypothetical protein